MKKHLLTILALTIFGVAGAQTHFSQTCGVTTGSTGMASIKLPSGNFATVSVNGSQLLLSRYIPSGALLNTVGLTSPDMTFTSVATMVQGAPNHVLVTGEGYLYSGGFQVFFVADVDLATNNMKIVTRNNGSFSYTKGPKAYYSPEGSIYALFPVYSYYDIHKLNSNMDPLWSKNFACDTITGKNPGMDCEVVDSSIIIIGKCDSIPGWCDVDTSGSLDTFKLFMTNGYTRIYNITKLSDGNILLAGLHSPVYASATDSRPLLVKVTRGGDVIWARKLDAGTGSPAFYRFVDVQATPDGKIVAFATQTEAYSDTYIDGACVFDANGNLLYSKKFGTYNSLAGTGVLYQLYDAKVYADGILMTGNSVDYDMGGITRNMMVFSDFNFDQVCQSTNVTVSSAGFSMGTTSNYGTANVYEIDGMPTNVNLANPPMTATVSAPVVCMSTTTSVDEEEQVNANVYPNPVMAGDAFAIKLENPGMYTFVITDLSGKLVRTESTIGNRASISTQGLATGAYVLNVMNNNRSVAVHKLMVR